MPDVQVVKETAPVATKDFFISYNHDDTTWAEWIAWQLEQAGFTTIVQAWDFRPGGNFVLEMQNAAAASRTIAVISPSYLKSSFTAPEWAAAFAQDPTGRENKLIPVRVRPCHPEGLLGQIIYIDLVDLDDVSARNTLLNGIGLRRNKPVSAPAFPGSSAPTFPGPATVPPPEMGDVPSSVHIRIDFPTEIPDSETCEIVLGFTVAGAGAELFLDLQQDGFYVDSESDSEAALDADHFRFEFPSPGTFQRKLLIRAKKAQDANYRVSASCHDASGKVWTRNTWYVRVTEAPWWWKLARFIIALWTIVRRRPVLSAAIALLVGVVWIGYVFVKAYRNASAGEKREMVIKNAFFRRPADHLSSKDEWNDFFEERAVTEEFWYLRNIDWRKPAELTLAIRDGGFAVTKAAFYDFDSVLEWNLRRDGRVALAFGVWPQSGDIERSRGYRFTLSERSQADGAVGIVLQGSKCKHLEPVSTCESLSLRGAEEVRAELCAENPIFEIKAQRVGETFTFRVAALYERFNCRPQVIGRWVFSDGSPRFVPFSPFGGIAFLGAQEVRQVQILKLSKPSNPQEP